MVLISGRSQAPGAGAFVAGTICLSHIKGIAGAIELVQLRIVQGQSGRTALRIFKLEVPIVGGSALSSKLPTIFRGDAVTGVAGKLHGLTIYWFATFCDLQRMVCAVFHDSDLCYIGLGVRCNRRNRQQADDQADRNQKANELLVHNFSP